MAINRFRSKALRSVDFPEGFNDLGGQRHVEEDVDAVDMAGDVEGSGGDDGLLSGDTRPCRFARAPFPPWARFAR